MECFAAKGGTACASTNARSAASSTKQSRYVLHTAGLSLRSPGRYILAHNARTESQLATISKKKKKKKQQPILCIDRRACKRNTKEYPASCAKGKKKIQKNKKEKGKGKRIIKRESQTRRRSALRVDDAEEELSINVVTFQIVTSFVSAAWQLVNYR